MSEMKLTYGMLKDINDRLGGLEESLPIDTSERFVNVFVLGVPRSGTTLATQVIFNHLGIGCTNNLMARFWKSPILGGLLSKSVIGDTKGSAYRSNYGSTEFPWEPHEFSWFWHDLLGIDARQGFSYPDPSAIDWPRVRSKICSLNNALGCSLVHKPLELVGYYLERFLDTFERAIYVYLERDDLDVACSIAKARLHSGAGLDAWWSSVPPASRLALLDGEPYNIQIAGQITFLKEMYSDKLTSVPPDRLVKVTYETLCERPLDLLNEISVKSRALGCEVPVSSMPEGRPARRETHDAELAQAMRSGFAAVERMALHA